MTARHTDSSELRDPDVNSTLDKHLGHVPKDRERSFLTEREAGNRLPLWHERARYGDLSEVTKGD